MPEDNFRIGSTKIFFRAGQLGVLEEMREERLSKIITWLQSWIRWYFVKKDFKRLQDQRMALLVIQRNLRKFLTLRNWLWWKLYSKVKPMLSMAKVEDEMKELEEKLKKTSEELEKESKLRKDLEDKNVKLLQEKNELFLQLESERGGAGDLEEKMQRLISQKSDLESQMQVRIFLYTLLPVNSILIHQIQMNPLSARRAAFLNQEYQSGSQSIFELLFTVDVC